MLYRHPAAILETFPANTTPLHSGAIHTAIVRRNATPDPLPPQHPAAAVNPSPQLPPPGRATVDTRLLFRQPIHLQSLHPFLE